MDNACGFSLMEPPMSPRCPPAAAGLDLYGKRRLIVKVQALEREITLLQEELKSVEDVQPASRCCKELDDFLEAKPDPFVTISRKQESHKLSPFWKRLCHCLHHQQMRSFCTCQSCYQQSSVPAASALERSLLKTVSSARDFHACRTHAPVSSLATIAQR